MYQVEHDLEMVEKMEKRESYGLQLEDLLGYDRETTHGCMRYQVFNDPYTVSLSGRTIYPAQNQQCQIQLKMNDCVADMRRTCLMGQIWIQDQGVCADMRQVFQLIQLNIGSSISDTLSYNHYAKQLRRNLEGIKIREDAMACKKNSFRDSQYGSFDNYNPYGAQLAAGSVLGTANALGASWPQTYSQTTGTAPNIQVQTVLSDPYGEYMRDIVANYFTCSNGQKIIQNGVQYSLVSFAIPFTELSDVFAAQPDIFMGLGQQIRMVLKTSLNNECLLKSGTSATPPSYGLHNLQLIVAYTELDQGQIDRIVQNSCEFQIPRLVPFTQASTTPVYNGVHSIGISDKVKRLFIGCFSNMKQSGSLTDSSNTGSNVLGGSNQVAAMQLQTGLLNWAVLPPIQLITIQYGSRQITINQQQLYIAQFLDLDENAKYPNKIQQMTQNGLCIDLGRYSSDLFGSTSGASSSLLVQITFALGSTSDPSAVSTQYRTLPFQTADWGPSDLANLQIFTFLEVGTDCLLQRGIYMPK